MNKGITFVFMLMCISIGNAQHKCWVCETEKPPEKTTKPPETTTTEAPETENTDGKRAKPKPIDFNDPALQNHKCHNSTHKGKKSRIAIHIFDL